MDELAPVRLRTIIYFHPQRLESIGVGSDLET